MAIEAGRFNFNGDKEVEWADVRLWINGVEVARMTGFEYGVDTDKEHLHTTGDDPISIQSGNRMPSGSITILKSAMDTLNTAAQVAGGRDITDIACDIFFTYKPKGTRPPVSDGCKGCEFKSWRKAMSQNKKSMECTLPFLFLGMATDKNGL